MRQSLGLSEANGLALTVSCVGVMVKVASVTLVGLEKANGSGWAVIKIIRGVASIQAAISTGISFADQRDGLVVHKIISRPGDEILSHNVVLEPESAPEPIPVVTYEEIFIDHDVSEAPQDMESICYNLCLDPACPRQRGEPRTLCPHSGKRGEM